MQRSKNISVRVGERGVVILIVAVVLLFVVGAMAALSIDVVTFYTARSEAQLAADGAALAGARALANSGMTSDLGAVADGLERSAETLATTIATRVATSNEVGGRTLRTSEVTVTFNGSDASFLTNPHVTVQVVRSDIPTFFARIWGNATVKVEAHATAEAYNPSGVKALGGTPLPVAPTCVKPWVLPNLSPNGGPIIDKTAGSIADPNLLGEDLTTKSPPVMLQPACKQGVCPSSTSGTPTPWQFYPGDQSDFPAPSVGLPECTDAFTKAYQNSIAGCVQTPIACGSTVALEAFHSNLRGDTYDAVNCLSHATAGATTADSVDTTVGPPSGTPFQFFAGSDDPLSKAGSIAAGTDHIFVSDSIVTVPIYDGQSLSVTPTSPVTIVGFVQLFVNSDGNAAPAGATPNAGILTRVLNIAGCGTGATGQPILGNGSSPVPVRLISQ